jgi:prepilin-type N-terminal cleavage/methylation domain-containing protein
MNKFRRVDGGFTLIEMLVVLLIAGILAAIAAPSLISQKKSMRSAISQTESMLKTVNMVARANAGNPYRIRSVYDAGADRYQLRVESRRSGTCSSTDRWIGDNNKFVDLPAGITIADEDGTAIPSVKTASLAANTICFNSLGESDGGEKKFSIVDMQGQSKVYRAKIQVTSVGDVLLTKFDNNGILLPH